MWSGRLPFPPVEEQETWVKENCHPHVLNTCCWPPAPFVDDIAEKIGCRPTKEDIGEDLYNKISFGPVYPEQFRLVGEGSDPEFARRILEEQFSTPLWDPYRSSEEGKKEYAVDLKGL